MAEQFVVVQGGGSETGKSELEELKAQLENERRQRQEAQKELDLQVSKP